MATTGALACSNAVEDASNGSSITISNLANVYDGDLATACNQSANGNPSRWVVCSFPAPSPAIATGATINGIRFVARAWKSGAAGGIPNFKAVLAGSISGTEKGIITLTGEMTPTDYTVGSLSDLHGITPTVAQINAGSLGCAFTLNQTASGGGRVGNVTMEVDFTAPVVAAGGAQNLTLGVG